MLSFGFKVNGTLAEPVVDPHPYADESGSTYVDESGATYENKD
jgi:hypothetical protein